MKHVKKMFDAFCCNQQDDADVAEHPRHVVFNTHNHLTITKSKSMEAEISVLVNQNVPHLFTSQQIYVKPKMTAKQIQNKKLLLIDLDKTIIYYSQQQGFIMRPYLRKFLTAIHKFYDIYIFTASTPSYLKDMLRRIQQNNGGIQYFSGYLTRQDCTKLLDYNNKTTYIKDISVIKNYPPQKIVVVDDIPESYCLNCDNAIPILPFYGKVPDNNLLFLIQTLMQIKDYEDVRNYIRGRYTFKSCSISTDIQNTNQTNSFNSSIKQINITIKTKNSL